MKLHLGVRETPYLEDPGVNTGDVAEWLEEKYHVMEIFAGSHIDEIADNMADNMAGIVEKIMSGGSAPEPQYLFNEAMGKTIDRFHEFLTLEEMAGWPGVPTQAALDGVQSRFKKLRGPRRPSFVDTGLYFDTFLAWVE